MALWSMNFGSHVFHHLFIVCKHLLHAVIIGLVFFLVGIDCNGFRQLYLHQGNKPLTYSMTEKQRGGSPVYSADCFHICLVSESKILIPMQTVFLIQEKGTSLAHIK